MHTDWTAVPHASLGYHFLRVQVRTAGPGGLQKEKGPKLKTENGDQVEMTTYALVCQVH